MEQGIKKWKKLYNKASIYYAMIAFLTFRVFRVVREYFKYFLLTFLSIYVTLTITIIHHYVIKISLRFSISFFIHYSLIS